MPSRKKPTRSYVEKLRDPAWQKRRLEIMNRDGFSCVRCTKSDSTLHVHHRYYEKGNDPWEYPDAALVTLCEECHEVVGARMSVMIKSIGMSSFWAQDRLFEILQRITQVSGTELLGSINELIHFYGITSGEFPGLNEGDDMGDEMKEFYYWISRRLVKWSSLFMDKQYGQP